MLSLIPTSVTIYCPCYSNLALFEGTRWRQLLVFMFDFCVEEVSLCVLPCFSEPYILGGQPTDDRIYVESRIERAPDYTEDRIEEWRVSEIIISNVKRQDDGLYECKAQNEGGEFFKSGHIQVRQSNLPVNLLGAAGTTVQSCTI